MRYPEHPRWGGGHEVSAPMRHSRSRMKIIAIGFNAHGTGLTRVMHSIMRRLADRHEIHYLGIGYSGEKSMIVV